MQQHKMQMGKKQFRIADIAELLDVKKNILRAWEDGFNVHAYRSDGGGRLYSLQDVEIFSLIKKQLQHHKASVEDVKRILEERFGSVKERKEAQPQASQGDRSCETAHEDKGEIIGEKELIREMVCEPVREVIQEPVQELAQEIALETVQETSVIEEPSSEQETVQGAVREESSQEGVSPAQICTSAKVQEQDDDAEIFEFEIRDNMANDRPALVVDNVAHAERESSGISRAAVSTSCFCTHKQKEIQEFKTQLLAFREVLRKS